MLRLSVTLALGTLVSAAATGLPGLWFSLGCYPDSSTARDLQAASFSSDAMSQKSCAEFCSSEGYSFAGLEFGRECYCDFMIHNNQFSVSAKECNLACSGDASSTCGAGNRIQIYQDPLYIPPSIVILTSTGYISNGCYTDDRTDRTLTEIPASLSHPITVESCTAACKKSGFKYAGVEYSDECYCGHFIGGNGFSTENEECDMQCSGDRREICGGADRVLVYQSLF